MIRRVRGLGVSVLMAALAMPASAGTYNAELDVRNTVEEFEHALKKSDIPAMAKLVTPDFVAFENGEITQWRSESDRSSIVHAARLLPNRRSRIDRVEVSCNLAWAYGRTEVGDVKAVANQRQLVMVTMYVLRQKSHRWKSVAVSWSVEPQPSADTK